MDALTNPAVLSLIALLAVIVVSLTSRINVGVLALALAWLVAVFAAGWKPDALMAAFPASLFLTLLGVTLLFGAAEKNGTLAALTDRAVRAWGKGAAAVPWLFFLIAGIASSLGPGAIAATALVAPLAMAAGATTGVSPFLMALMVANGANAGNLSPFSSVGLIVQAQMAKVGLAGHDANVFLANFVAHTLAALAAYLLFGGLTMLRARRTARPAFQLAIAPIEPRHWLTIAVLGAWIAGVMFLGMSPGLTGLAAAALLILGGLVEDRSAMASIPWTVIVMVCGVSVLVGVLEKTGGMDLFTTMLSRLTAPGLANGMMAFVTGLISTYSSTSGVVYPAFLPTVTGLVEKLGGGDPLQLALSINVGAALVDVSPLSTIGALCVAALPAREDAPLLFRRLLAWGFAMVVAGAVFCQVFIRFFA
jgi:Na+/H+ antiporter NhaD/arsenite permease-like protein